jgi:hypothetical protein
MKLVLALSVFFLSACASQSKYVWSHPSIPESEISKHRSATKSRCLQKAKLSTKGSCYGLKRKYRKYCQEKKANLRQRAFNQCMNKNGYRWVAY